MNQVITNPEWIFDGFIKTEAEKPNQDSNKYRLSFKKRKEMLEIFPLISLRSILEIYLQNMSKECSESAF